MYASINVNIKRYSVVNGSTKNRIVSPCPFVRLSASSETAGSGLLIFGLNFIDSEFILNYDIKKCGGPL